MFNLIIVYFLKNFELFHLKQHLHIHKELSGDILLVNKFSGAG